MLVEIENLRITFASRTQTFEAVRGVSLSIGKEKFAIVGESGSGKSLTARSLMQLLPGSARVEADKLSFDGIDLRSADEKTLRRIRGKRVAARYPHEVSGGMRQRAMIAMMLAPDPELLIADEPTCALDATVQADILKLIDDLVSRRGMGLILNSHDLPLVSHFCDRVAAMYAGRVVEMLAAKDLHLAQHPYTRGLLACLPSLKHPRERLPVMKRDEPWRNG